MRRWPFRIAAYARRQTGTLAGVLVLILAGAGLEALKPWPLKLLIDHVLGHDPWPAGLSWITRLPDAGSSAGMIAWLTAATVALYIVSAAVRMSQTYLQTGAGSRMLYALGGDLFEHLQRLSLRFHQRNRTGDLLQRVITDAGCARDLVVNVMLPAVTSVTTLLMLFVIMWRLDRVLTTVSLAVTPLIVLAIRLFANEMEVRSYEQSELEGQMMGVAEQTLTAIPIVQAFGREPHEDRRFSELTERTGRAYLRMIASQLWFKLATAAATAIGTAAMLLLGGWHVLDGELSVGALLVFLSYLASLYQPLESISYLMAGYASAAGGARRVLQVLDTGDAVSDRATATGWRPASDGRAPGIQIDDVTFGYELGVPVLSDVRITVQPGERVALVGLTGSGKSTLVALLPRLFDPWSGRILVGGVDVRDVTLASLRAQMAIVLQDPYLLPLTVADNISFGRPAASREDVVAAARAAQADAFIRQLDHGYDTPIGERGVLLSGGQRQRLAIARAFLRDSPILLLDEPTAALDSETEHDLMDAMQALMHGRTVVIVAHRLSTIRDVDRIYVLDAGRVVEEGSEPELLARGGAYARFHRLQHGVAGQVDP